MNREEFMSWLSDWLLASGSVRETRDLILDDGRVLISVHMLNSANQSGDRFTIDVKVDA